MKTDHGSYPYVTSSNQPLVVLALVQELAPIKSIVLLHHKSLCNPNGEGPFPTEQNNEIGQHLQNKDVIGTTTGRIRRCV